MPICSARFDQVCDRLSFLLVGTECHETVYLINDEEQPYSFSFVETSCYSDGHAAKVKVQPMSGTLQPNSKYGVYLMDR